MGNYFLIIVKILFFFPPKLGRGRVIHTHECHEGLNLKITWKHTKIMVNPTNIPLVKLESVVTILLTIHENIRTRKMKSGSTLGLEPLQPCLDFLK